MLAVGGSILGVVAVVFGARLIVDPCFRERYDTSRFQGVMDPADRLWFRGPATRTARDDNWKRVGWMIVGIGAIDLIGVIVYLIVE
jgi:hypothetical protein